MQDFASTTFSPHGALQVSDLALIRRERFLFSNVNLVLKPGESLILQGPNGSGKSSLLRVLAGLLDAEKGELDNPFSMGWLGHHNALKGSSTLETELRFWAQLDQQGVESYGHVMELFDLTELADIPTGLLSNGQCRRAALARLVLSGAQLWLLDEPSVGLDKANVHRLGHILQKHQEKGGLWIAATHVPLGTQPDKVLNLEYPHPAPLST